jgi:hypothetical protein
MQQETMISPTPSHNADDAYLRDRKCAHRLINHTACLPLCSYLVPPPSTPLRLLRKTASQKSKTIAITNSSSSRKRKHCPET